MRLDTAEMSRKLSTPNESLWADGDNLMCPNRIPLKRCTVRRNITPPDGQGIAAYWYMPGGGRLGRENFHFFCLRCDFAQQQQTAAAVLAHGCVVPAGVACFSSCATLASRPRLAWRGGGLEDRKEQGSRRRHRWRQCRNRAETTVQAAAVTLNCGRTCHHHQQQQQQ